MHRKDLQSDFHLDFQRDDCRLTTSIPCTCGELFQGSLDGEPCLVSCPVSIFSTASFIGPDKGYKVPGEKARLALSRLPHKSDMAGEIHIKNNLPVGRGFWYQHG